MAVPTREDFLTQIDGDLKAGTEDKAVLKERRDRVAATKTDKAAAEAYHGHIEEVRSQPG